MHVSTLLAAFNIAPGEGLPVALLLSHSFFMGLAGVLFYTAESAIFLAAFAPTTLQGSQMTDFETAAGIVVGALFFVLVVAYARRPMSTQHK